MLWQVITIVMAIKGSANTCSVPAIIEGMAPSDLWPDCSSLWQELRVGDSHGREEGGGGEEGGNMISGEMGET